MCHGRGTFDTKNWNCHCEYQWNWRADSNSDNSEWRVANFNISTAEHHRKTSENNNKKIYNQEMPFSRTFTIWQKPELYLHAKVKLNDVVTRTCVVFEHANTLLCGEYFVLLKFSTVLRNRVDRIPRRIHLTVYCRVIVGILQWHVRNSITFLHTSQIGCIFFHYCNFSSLNICNHTYYAFACILSIFLSIS